MLFAVCRLAVGPRWCEPVGDFVGLTSAGALIGLTGRRYTVGVTLIGGRGPVYAGVRTAGGVLTVGVDLTSTGAGELLFAAGGVPWGRHRVEPLAIRSDLTPAAVTGPTIIVSLWPPAVLPDTDGSGPIPLGTAAPSSDGTKCPAPMTGRTAPGVRGTDLLSARPLGTLEISRANTASRWDAL